MIVIFADDTNLISGGKHWKELLFAVERQLEINKLSLNIKKTKFMDSGNRMVIDGKIELKIGDDIIV